MKGPADLRGFPSAPRSRPPWTNLTSARRIIVAGTPAVSKAARIEMLRADASRGLGENSEHADALTQLHPDTRRFIRTAGAQVEFGDVRARVGSPAPPMLDRALHRRNGIVAWPSPVECLREVRVALQHPHATGIRREIDEYSARFLEPSRLERFLDDTSYEYRA